MLKKSTKMVALLLIFTFIFALTGCSDEFEAKWEKVWDDRGDATTTTEAPSSKTLQPQNTAETVEYFNTLLKTIRKSTPGFHVESKRDANDVKSDNELLKAAVPTLKSYIFKKAKADCKFGESAKDFYQMTGDVNANFVNAADVLSAKCEMIEGNYEITIMLKDEAAKNDSTITSKYFKLDNKADVLKEFQKAKDYLTISDYDLFYTGSSIKCVVDRLTDTVSQITFTKSENISTQVTGAGELIDMGDAELSFLYTDEITYSNFVIVDPAITTVPAE